MLLAVAAAAMILTMARPWRIPEWMWPVAGAGLLVVLAQEPAPAALAAVAAQWNVLLFILGLMGLAAAAETSGVFAWITAVVAERARGSRRRLFVLLFFTGAAIALALSNDATAIVFTPVVLRAIRAHDGDGMPYLLACTFVANTASFGLPFANPANVMILPHPDAGSYVLHLGPPQIAAIAINLLIFLAVFRRDLSGRYAFEAAPPLAPRARATLFAFGGVTAAYAIALILRWPLGPVAAMGSLVALAVARVPPAAALRAVGWSTFALLAGLFVLLDGVARTGAVASALHGLQDAARYGTLALDAGAAFGSALLSGLFNNLPVAVASSYAVARAPAEHFAYALIAGVDLGPNLTTTGSLSTLLWLGVLRERGVRVSRRQYLKIGALVVPSTLAVTILWLALVR